MWILKSIICLSIIGIIAFLLRNKKKGIREMVCSMAFLPYSFFVKSPEVIVLSAIILFVIGFYMYFNKEKNVIILDSKLRVCSRCGKLKDDVDNNGICGECYKQYFK